MKMKDRTKKMFADELERMLAEMPFEKVRVIELAKRCSATPQAFYYHFRDKYELVAWMFLQEFFDVMQPAELSTAESITEMHKRFDSRKSFYKKVFNDKSQNSIESFIFEFNIRYSCEAVKFHYGEAPITQEQMLAIRYHSYGIVGLLRDWLYDQIDTDLLTISEFDYARIPPFLKEALSNYTDLGGLREAFK